MVEVPMCAQHGLRQFAKQGELRVNACGVKTWINQYAALATGLASDVAVRREDTRGYLPQRVIDLPEHRGGMHQGELARYRIYQFSHHVARQLTPPRKTVCAVM